MSEPSESLKNFITRSSGVKLIVDVSKSYTVDDITLIPGEDYEISDYYQGKIRYRYVGVVHGLEKIMKNVSDFEYVNVINQPIFCKYLTHSDRYESGVSFFDTFYGSEIKHLMINNNSSPR